MAAVSIVVLLLMISGTAQTQQPSKIAPGSWLSPTTQPWLSPSTRFAFGFYQQGSTGFAVGIWLGHDADKIVVWTAVRDDPPVASNAKLDFAEDGMLILRDEKGRPTLIANATKSVTHASMLDSGNFVLYNKDSEIVWQSFEHPTDTILGSQTLFAGSQLFSSLTKNDHSTGGFRLKMQDDGNLVLYPTKTGDTSDDAYWDAGTFDHGAEFHLFLNHTGSLLIINGTTSVIVEYLYSSPSSADSGNTIYRATIDFDGSFRLYSHAYDENGSIGVSIWTKPDSPCQVKTFCGFNSYCTFNDNKPYCLCLTGTDFVDPNDWSRGCERNFLEAACTGGKGNETLYNITKMENMDWGDYPYFEAEMETIDECSRSCLEDCDCGAALFRDGYCAKQSLPLRYVRRDREQKSTALLKQGVRSIKRSNETNPIQRKPVMVVSKTAVSQIILTISGFAALSCVALAISVLFIFKSSVLKYRRLMDGNAGISAEVTLRLFSYNELKRATNGFKEEIGKGSFGAVYKGALYKGARLVAVKRLEKLIEEGEREFRAEMRAIGRTHHRNLVRLLGYCAEDSKRLLVYEYMSNGSLADLLFRADRRPDWNERVRIAQDVAKGIFYLHEECEAPIIHCDIKPQNILMDDFWTAKISDFGLAKFLMPDQTRTFTGIRGTRGYLAPEWHKNTPISVKADVYSYGIVLLEILCCRRNIELNISNDDEIYLATWIYKCFVTRELDKIVRGEEADKTSLENMVKVALWCIQDEPALRPSMKSVLLMLEGIADVSIPPCPAATST